MQKFKSHKTVSAFLIGAIHRFVDGTADVVSKSGQERANVTLEWFEKRYHGVPSDKGVFVEYEDGFQSWLPTDVFNAGYTPIDQPEPTQGLPVAGYKPTQPQWALDLVNENKALEERVLRQVEKHQGDMLIEGVDQRFVSIAKTKLQEAFMWLNRGVFQPGRVKLPEDEA